MKERKANRVGRQLDDMSPVELTAEWVGMDLSKAGARKLTTLWTYARGETVASERVDMHWLAEEYLEQCLAELYHSPHPEARQWLRRRWQQIGTTDVDRVLRAALGRFHAENSDPVPLLELSALSGVTVAALRNYGGAGKGVLEIESGQASAKSVRKWLGLPRVK